MLRGILFLLGAELCFSFATVAAKFVTQCTTISGLEVVFFRFLLGVIFAGALIMQEKISLKPYRWDLVMQRGIYNTIAVGLFFMAVQYTTVTNANMLNMTYPAFIFLIAPWLCKEKTNAYQLIYLLLTILGIYFVVNPQFNTLNAGDIYGILSAVGAAFGITTLRKARAFDHTAVILFYLMLIGTIMIGLWLIPNFIMPPNLHIWLWIMISAICGVLGQAAITIGYRYISATSGSLVSASRIIFASIFGISIFHEPLTISLIIGGGLILISLIGTNLHKN